MFKRGKIQNLWLIYFLADFGAIVAAYYTTLLVRFYGMSGERLFTVLNRFLRVRDTGVLGEGFRSFYFDSAPRIIFFLTATLCVLYALNNLYTGRRFIRRRPIAWNIIVANAIAIGLFYAYFYLRRNVFHPRSIFALVIFLNVLFCILFRITVDRLLVFVRRRFFIDQHKGVLVGSNGESDFINGLVENIYPHGLSIVDRIGFHPDQSFEDLIRKIDESVGRRGADVVLLAEKRLSVGQIMLVLEKAENWAASVKVLSDKMDVLMNQARMPVDMIHGVPLVHFEAPSLKGPGLFKRLVSFLFAFVMTAVLLPLMGMIALLIKMSSKGPVFFVQERIGVNRKPFKMLKFRTMYDRSDEVQAQVEEFNESGGGLFKIRKDPRITPVGRFLRRFSLDELPQLINVILGEMTIVGPRPLPRRDFENYYEDWHYSRHSGMPGLTCLWQVSGRSEIDFHNMCILDVFYLCNRDWILDLKIVLRTLWVVVFAKGAY
jgi:exopolysaccharide biosynthesis polyprenyl glycosylphosphotransferase